MRKLIGSYSIFELIISLLMFGVFLKFNSLYFVEFFSGPTPDRKTLFLVVFVNLILITVISLPALGKLASNISNESIEKFLAFPKEGERFTFPVLTEFLGNQALASFLATVLIFTGKEAFSAVGGDVLALYIYVLYVIAIAIAVLSLVRIIQYFNHSWWQYLLVSVCSSAVMFSFIGVGIRMGA
ncbi:hypothetical protein QYS36_13225 [Pseudomonas sp. G34]|uniref:hypothetical protein n=1 Tax=Pseudomonas sp. G34 TaxID=3059083 RepID=UPI00280A2836|nr:hypothetical protein [Pseudomonas sp. G34]MDQ7985900.1 hypothetical protein [Pseudomonas sp. G34]